jgi:hypothetical protein
MANIARVIPQNEIERTIGSCADRRQAMHLNAMTMRSHNYTEVRVYLEKEHPNWLRAPTPRHINAPADYWPQKVLAVSSANAAM